MKKAAGAYTENASASVINEPNFDPSFGNISQQ